MAWHSQTIVIVLKQTIAIVYRRKEVNWYTFTQTTTHHTNNLLNGERWKHRSAPYFRACSKGGFPNEKSQKLLSLILSILIIFCGCSAQKEVTSLELPGGPAAPQESLDLNAVPSAPTVEIDTTQKETDNGDLFPCKKSEANSSY